HRRGVVLQQRQLVDETLGQDVGPRGEDLPELDEGRPQFGECLAKPPRRRRAQLFGRRPLSLFAPAEHVPDLGAIPQLAEAMARHHRADLAQPPQILDGLDRHYSIIFCRVASLRSSPTLCSASRAAGYCEKIFSTAAEGKATRSTSFTAVQV